MPQIVGQGFKSWVAQQVKDRQNLLGKQNYSPQELNYLNNRKPWIKVASAVEIDGKNIGELSQFGSGKELAQKFALNSRDYQSGVAQGGVAESGGLQVDKSYGFASNPTQYGFKPPMGIEKLEVKTKGDNGSLKEATLSVKAYSPTQFNIIELLYLRLGYNVLVEFGHNFYVSGGVVYPMETTLVDSGWFGIAGSPEERLPNAQKAIVRLREKYNGNYDGFVGKVTNFDWSLNKDGVYNITIKIMSHGDLLSSLPVNKKTIVADDGEFGESLLETVGRWLTEIPYIGKIFEGLGGFVDDLLNFVGLGEADNPELPEEPPDISKKFLENAKDVTDINGFLYFLYRTLYKEAGNNKNNGAASYKFKKGGNPYAYFLAQKNKSPFRGTLGGSPYDIFDIKAKGKNEEGEKEGYQDDKFISLKFYLEILNSFCLFYTVEDSESFGKPSGEQNGPVKFLTDEDKQLCATHPLQYSADPSICIIKSRGDVSAINESVYKTFKSTIGGSYVGKILNIYINMNFAAELLYNAARNKDNVTSVEQHVQEILDGINASLGGINKLRVKVDEDSNEAYIYDETILPLRDNLATAIGNSGLNDKPTMFNVLSNDSFVRDFSIKSKIDDDLAAIITIGAQQGGVTEQIDGSGFAAWNKGLKDFISPANVTASDSTTISEKRALLREQRSAAAKAGISLYKTHEKIKLKYIGSARQALTTYLKNEKALQGAESALGGRGGSPLVGFIPINLNLTIDGLSGFKIFEKYTIPSKFLPASYPETIDFIIKKYSHTIDQNSWTTELESLSIPRADNQPASAIAGTPTGLSQLFDSLSEFETKRQQAKEDFESTAGAFTETLGGRPPAQIPRCNQIQISPTSINTFDGLGIEYTGTNRWWDHPEHSWRDKVMYGIFRDVFGITNPYSLQAMSEIAEKEGGWKIGPAFREYMNYSEARTLEIFGQSGRTFQDAAWDAYKDWHGGSESRKAMLTTYAVYWARYEYSSDKNSKAAIDLALAMCERAFDGKNTIDIADDTGQFIAGDGGNLTSLGVNYKVKDLLNGYYDNWGGADYSSEMVENMRSLWKEYKAAKARGEYSDTSGYRWAWNSYLGQGEGVRWNNNCTPAYRLFGTPNINNRWPEIIAAQIYRGVGAVQYTHFYNQMETVNELHQHGFGKVDASGEWQPGNITWVNPPNPTSIWTGIDPKIRLCITSVVAHCKKNPKGPLFGTDLKPYYRYGNLMAVNGCLNGIESTYKGMLVALWFLRKVDPRYPGPGGGNCVVGHLNGFPNRVSANAALALANSGGYNAGAHNAWEGILERWNHWRIGGR